MGDASVTVVKTDAGVNIEDAIRAKQLQGVDPKYYRVTAALDQLLAQETLTPEAVAELESIRDIHSLRTASSAEIRQVKKAAVIEHYQRREGDTGSTEVQVAVLTERINFLNFHLARFPKDVRLKRTLAILTSRRRKLLKYLRVHRFRTYQVMLRDLNIDEVALENEGRLTTTLPFLRVEDPKKKRKQMLLKLQRIERRKRKKN